MPQQWVVLLLHFKCSLQAEVGCLLKLVVAENWKPSPGLTKLDANRKSKEIHQKIKETSLPLIKLRNGLIAFQSCIPKVRSSHNMNIFSSHFSSKSRRSCCPWRCPFFETEVAYWDSTRRTGGTVSCWDRASFKQNNVDSMPGEAYLTPIAVGRFLD